MPVRSRPELFAPNALYDTNTARTPKPQQRLLKCLTPSQAYDQSMVIRSKFTTGAWTVRQNPCDANLAESTRRKKSVTATLYQQIRRNYLLSALRGLSIREATEAENPALKPAVRIIRESQDQTPSSGQKQIPDYDPVAAIQREIEKVHRRGAGGSAEN